MTRKQISERFFKVNTRAILFFFIIKKKEKKNHSRNIFNEQRERGKSLWPTAADPNFPLKLLTVV